MNQDQSVNASHRNQPSCNGGLPKRGWSAKKTFIVADNDLHGFLLLSRRDPRKSTSITCPLNRSSRIAGVILERFENSDQLRETSTWKSEVLREVLAAANNTRLVECGEAHCLCFVELGILEGRDSKKPIHQSGWQILLFHINEIRPNDGYGRG